MPPRPPLSWLERRGQLDLLGSEASVVALCGPTGAGKTTTLAAWAADRHDVAWVDGSEIHDGEVPGSEVPGEGFLVIDGADELPPQGWDALEAAMRDRPGLRLRLAVHSASAIPPHWDAELVTELFFDADEVAQYLGAHSSMADPLLVTLLTGGLPAAVRAVARSRAATGEQITAVLSRDRTVSLPAGSELLVLPHYLTERVVDELGGPPDFLDRAERAGWGSWSPDPGVRVFTLTAPRRASVRARLTLPKGRERELRARLAEIFLEEGASRAAVAEASAALRLDLVDAALKQAGMPVLWDHGYEVSERLAPLPLMQVRKYPVIALARALTLNVHRASRLTAIEMFGVAVVGARTKPKRSADRALMRVVESVGSRLIGLGDGGLRSAHKAAEMMSEMSETEREALGSLEPDLHLHAAVSMFYGGDHRGARVEFEWALGGATRPGARLQAIGGLAMIEALDGDLPAARSWVEIAESRSWPQAMLDEYPGSMLRIAQAYLAIEDLDFALARQRIAAIWPIVDTIEHWALMTCARALADLGSGRPGEALELLRRMREHRTARRGSTATVQRHLDIVENLLLLAVGDLAGARGLAARRDDPVPLRLAVARTALLDGRDDRALDLAAGSEARTPQERLARTTVEAVLLHRLGRDAEAGERVEQARVLHRAYGLRSPFLFVPAAERGLFGELMAGVPQVLGAPGRTPRLTPRERVVIAELVRTANVDQIARRLQVSVNTVKSQRRSLYRKLGVRSRDEAVAEALAHGLLD